MRIVHVVTACAALISAFHRAETVHSERRLQTKDQPLQPRNDNGTDISKITFTTLRPEVTSFSSVARSSVHVHLRKGASKVRPSRSMSFRLRKSRNKGARRRRQLQKNGGNTVRVGRSYEIGDNRIDHQVESVQGPPEAFEDGAVHIEPVYRVTKNKNILDSILNVLRRVINPPKSVGPLVGPFHFPGIGDNVYIRLLEQDQPDNLVIRLVSHLPVSDIETTLDKDIISAAELAKHSAIPSIGHELLSHAEVPSISHDLVSHPQTISHESLAPSSNSHGTSYGGHGPVKAKKMSPDSTLSASNDATEVSKQRTISEIASQVKVPYVSRTYKMVNLQNADQTTDQRLVRHRKRVQHFDVSSKPGEQKNNTRNIQGHRGNRYQDSVEHSYQFPLTNYSDLAIPLRGNIQESYFSRPVNVSTSQHMAQLGPILPLKSPISDRYTINNSNGSVENGPRYSLEFTSKKMRYLNLDGTVETPEDEPIKDEGFKPVITNPMPKLIRSVGKWEPLRGASLRPRGENKLSVNVNGQQKNFLDRSDSDAILDTSEESSQDGGHRGIGTDTGNIATNTQGTKFSNCSHGENEKSEMNNSTGIVRPATVKSVFGGASQKPRLESLQPERGLE